MRPTHSNIRLPGLGVGGYCLTKDPAFAWASAREIYDLDGHNIPFSRLAIEVNKNMPLHTVDRLEILLSGELQNKEILIKDTLFEGKYSAEYESGSDYFLNSVGEQIKKRGSLTLKQKQSLNKMYKRFKKRVEKNAKKSEKNA